MTLNKGLVGHWTMDSRDTDGSVMYDRSPYNHDMQIPSNVSTGSSGQVGESFTFPGQANEGLQGPDEDSYGGALGESSDKFSACAFVFPTDLTSLPNGSTNHNTENVIFAHSSGADNDNFELGVGADGLVDVYIDSNSVDTQVTPFNDTAILANEWSHIAITADLAAGEIKVYVNGELDATDTSTWNGGSTLDQAPSPLGIGESFHNSSPFIGDIDEARLYNRILSESEVSALYNMRSQRQQNIVANVTYNDSQSLYDSNDHAESRSELDNFFDTSRSDVSNIFTTNHDRSSINHGLEGQSTSEFGSVNSAPYYINQEDGYSWKLEGEWTAPETGTYTFGIDGDDAMDAIINGTLVASFYGGHGFDGTVDNHSGTINLGSGQRCTVSFRYEEGGGGSGFTVGYKKPSDSTYVLFPADEVF